VTENAASSDVGPAGPGVPQRAPCVLRADAQRNIGSLLEAAEAVFAAAGVDAPAKTSPIWPASESERCRSSAQDVVHPRWRAAGNAQFPAHCRQALGRPRDPDHDGLGARRQIAFPPMRSSSAPSAENPGSADARLRGSCGAGRRQPCCSTTGPGL
jgi:hypothetical protein